MLLIDVMAGKTSDILEYLNELQKTRPTHKGMVRVRSYIVPGFERKPPRRRVISIETLRKQRAAKREAEKLLKAHG